MVSLGRRRGPGGPRWMVRSLTDCFFPHTVHCVIRTLRGVGYLKGLGGNKARTVKGKRRNGSPGFEIFVNWDRLAMCYGDWNTYRLSLGYLRLA